MTTAIHPGDYLLANPVGTPVDVLAVTDEGITVAQLAYDGEHFTIPWDKIGDASDQWTHLPAHPVF